MIAPDVYLTQADVSSDEAPSSPIEKPIVIPSIRSGYSTAQEESAPPESFTMNDSLTVSVGRQEVDMGAGKVDEESTGVAASYTMGSMTVAAHTNKTDDVGGTSGSEDSVTEVSVAFAF